MKSLTNAGKLLAVTATVLLSTTMMGASASASEVYQGYNGHNCVTGTSASDFNATWNGKDTFTVTTRNNDPVCNDVTLYGSSYVLTSPDYKGGLFGSVGSYPQTLYKTVTTTIQKGKTGATTTDNGYHYSTTVVVPLSPCGNQQVDLYVGPEITTVGAAGHGSQYIAGNIITPFNSTVCSGGQGGGTPPTTTTTTTTPPQVLADTTVAPAAAQLTDTGLNTWVASLLAVATMGSAIFVARKKAVVTNDAQ